MKISSPKLGIQLMFKLLILSLLLHSAAWAQCGLTGDGTAESPWLINDYDELLLMAKGDCTNAFASNYQLEAHIDASASRSGSTWVPFDFFGQLNGNGYTILDLYVNRPTTSYNGLFSRLQNGASVRKLGLRNIEIIGSSYTAGIAGYHYGTISECYVSGSVRGVQYVGSIAGRTAGDTTMNTYSSASVYGTSSYTGGFLGRTSGSRTVNNYFTGRISGTTLINAFIYAISGTFSNNYFNLETTGRSSGSGATALTSEQFGVASSFANWDFDSTWEISNNSFPVQQSISLHQAQLWGSEIILASVGKTDTTDLNNIFEIPAESYSFAGVQSEVNPNISIEGSLLLLDATSYSEGFNDTVSVELVLGEDTTTYSLVVLYTDLEGEGTEEEPYLISSWENLLKIQGINALYDGAYFKLTANIDASVSRFLNPNPSNPTLHYGWEPIPEFTGHIDGDGYVIYNLFINRTTEYLGLVSRLLTDASIKNLGLVNIDYNGNNSVGAFAGYSLGSISNSYASGSIKGGNQLGGFVGYGSSDTLLNVYSTVDLQGSSEIGGLIGDVRSSFIGNSYYNGTLLGTNSTGGLAGYRIGGTVVNSYWHDEMTSNDITDNYTDGVALSTVDMKNKFRFENWNFVNLWEMNANGFPIQSNMKLHPAQKLKPTVFLTGLESTLKIDLSEHFVVVEDTSLEFSEFNSFNSIPNSLSGDSLIIDGTLVTEAIIDTIEFDVISSGLKVRHSIIISFHPLSGDGSEENPFLLNTLEDFSSVQSLIKIVPDAHFLLTTNLDASETVNWDNGQGWTPIYNFTGHFDGGGHIISNLYINRSGTNNGLIGSTNGNASVKRVGIVNCDITGGGHTAGVVGSNIGGDISEVFVSGTIASSSYVGGVVGYSSGGSIKNTYNTAHVGQRSSNDNVYMGGIVGYMTSQVVVENNYSTGGIFANSYNDKGDIYGYRSSGTLVRNYWNIESSTAPKTAEDEYSGGPKGGIASTDPESAGLTIVEMMDQNSYVGWDFDSVWAINSNGYPYLRNVNNNSAHSKLHLALVKAGQSSQFIFSDLFVGSQDSVVSVDSLGNLDSLAHTISGDTLTVNPALTDGGVKDSIDVVVLSNGVTTNFRIKFTVVALEGDGSENAPFLITNFDDLLQLRVLDSIKAGNYYELTQDIDASASRTLNEEDEDRKETRSKLEFTPPPGEFYGWLPIEEFKGHLDGNGYAIRGLYINRPGHSGMGVFDYIRTGASITNLALDSIEYSIGQESGGLARYNYGIIDSVSINGIIINDSTSDNIGGMVAYNYGSITNSRVEMDLKGERYIGGLVGTLRNNGVVSNSSYNGTLSGKYYTGGLVAYVNSNTQIINSHAMGEVIGVDYAGGLVGYTNGNNAPIINSYSELSIKGNNYVGGLVGDASYAKISGSYSKGSVEGNDYVGGLAGRYDDETLDSSYFEGQVTGNDLVGGLVGIFEDGLMENSSFEGQVNGKNYVGGAIGSIDDATLTKVNTAGMVSGMGNVGGIVGHLDDSNIYTSVAKIDIEANERVGGLVGSINDGGNITNSTALGNIIGVDYVGGLVGEAYSITFSGNSYVGKVKGEEYIGGFGGYIDANVSNSYTCAYVTGTDYFGAFVGYAEDNEIENNYSCGAVFGSDTASNFGGFAGDAGDSYLSGNYSTARVFGSTNSGFAEGLGNDNDTNYFNISLVGTDTANSDSANASYIVGLTQDLFVLEASFTALDFEDSWKIADGLAYPVLQNVYNLPVAIPDFASVETSFSNMAYLISNDYDYETDSRQYIAQLVVVDSVTKGSVTNNVFTFDTAAVAGDKDTLAYHLGKITAEGDTLWRYDFTPVVITKIAANTAPIATADTYSVVEDGSGCMALDTLLVNDTDAESASLNIVSVYGNTNGQLTVDSEEACYTPNANFNGSETLSYIVSDGELSDTTTIAVTVSSVNDVPVLNSVTLPDFTEDTDLIITNAMIDYTDVDGDAIGEILVSVAANATVSGSTITPATNFYGQLEVDVAITDGQDTSNTVTVFVNVLSENDAIQITAIDDFSIVEDGNATITLDMIDFVNVENDPNITMIIRSGANYTANGLTITPTPNFNGTLDVAVALFDGIDTSANFVKQVTVTPVNDAPVINQTSSLTAMENTNFVISAGAIQYTDVDGDSISAIILGSGDNFSSNGTTVYPKTDFVGNIVVPIAISDGMDTSAFYNATIVIFEDTTTVIIPDDSTAVEDPNDAPIITGINLPSIYENDSLAITKGMIQFVDQDGDSIVTVILSVGENYTLAGNVVKPTPGFSGQLSIPVAITDGQDTSITFNANLTVLEFNDAPVVALPDTIHIPKTVSPNDILVQLGVTDSDTPIESLIWKIEGLYAGAFRIDSNNLIVNQIPTFEQDTSITIVLSLIDGSNVITDSILVMIEGRDEVAPILSESGLEVGFININGIQISNVEAANRVNLYSLQGELIHSIDINADGFYQWSSPVLHGIYLLEMTGNASRSVRSIQIRN